MRLASMTDNLTSLPVDHPTRWNSAEVARHNRRGDCWMTLRGIVFDVTAYMEFHPGGSEELIRGAGLDATDLFTEAHAWVNYESMLASCVVGRLDEDAPDHGTAGGVPAPDRAGPAVAATSSPTCPTAAAAGAGPASPSLLSAAADAAKAVRWHSVRLLRRTPCGAGCFPSADAAVSSSAGAGVAAPPARVRCELLEFALPSADDTLWPLSEPAGRHLQVLARPPMPASAEEAARLVAQGRVVGTPSALQIVREFTPVSSPSHRGSFTLAVKLYPRGKMSRLLAALPVGGSVQVRGPRGSFTYRRGRASMGGKTDLPVSALLLAGGGSGVTPALQVARAAAEDEADDTPVHLLLAHSSPENSMLVAEAKALAEAHPGQIRLVVLFSTSLPTEPLCSCDVTHAGTTAGASEMSSASTGDAAINSRGGQTTTLRARLDADILRKAWPAPESGHVVAWCGPPGFNAAVDLAARSLYFPADRMHEF